MAPPNNRTASSPSKSRGNMYIASIYIQYPWKVTYETGNARGCLRRRTPNFYCKIFTFFYFFLIKCVLP